MSTVFIRVLEEMHDKDGALRSAIKRDPIGGRWQLFEVNPATFCSVSGSPFAYWVSENLRATFAKFTRFEADGRVAKRGVNSNDDGRFLRLAWECVGSKWVPHVKGGRWAPFYADPHMLLNWGTDGRELLAERVTTREYKFAIVPSRELYLRPGLTWTLRTKSDLSMRVMPAGCIFGSKGPAVIVENDDVGLLLALGALSNSQVFRSLIEFQLAAAEPTGRGGVARSYEVGVIQKTPLANLSKSDVAALARLARRAWSLRRALDTVNEASHAFVLPGGLNERIAGLDRDAIARELDALQKAIDEAAFSLYGIGPEDRTAIGTSAEVATEGEDAAVDEADDAGDESSDDEASGGAGVEALSSWLVGVAFGRFDPRLATSERAIPPEPEPFDALPSRAPGMYPEGEECGDRSDILVDDEGRADDIAACSIAVAERVRVDVPESLRSWLAKEFFPLHIKMYSKSRRKAPIYWQLATPSASYSVWLYIHAFSKDTFFRVQNDYVGPKLAHEERRLESLSSELRDGATAEQRKALATQEAFVEELRAFLEEVKRVAPLWNPNLDDGVIINFAPLWRLVPQHKAWQKELKSTWDALCDGKYDWAHLAMRLWPESVVPKCAKDRSLAIAHGLEEVFWVEGTDGKWTARKTPTRSVDELVRERTSPAVKAALQSLLEAPAATGNAKKTKRGKVNA